MVSWSLLQIVRGAGATPEAEPKALLFFRLLQVNPCSLWLFAPIETTGAGMATMPLNSWSVASIRQTSGISLEEIAQNTKLKITTLKAIEDANFDVLPGGIYNISYIRQYARAIGVDEGALVKMYQSLRPEENQSQASAR
jgi:Helix-turn-helix domain